MAEELPLGNWVKLPLGRWKCVKISKWEITERKIYDKRLGRTKTVRALVCWVYEEDGEPVDKILSILSEKLAAMMLPYLKRPDFDKLTFCIKREGTGFATEYQLIVRGA